MPFDWAEYLVLANFLSTQQGAGSPAEASKRSAVSRAYFAVFCSTRNYARDKLHYVPSKKAEDHEQLRTYLQAQGTAKLADVAVALQNLREWRNYCDYDDTLRGLDIMVKLALREAAEVMKKLQ
jgi:hypothetical protein